MPRALFQSVSGIAAQARHAALLRLAATAKSQPNRSAPGRARRRSSRRRPGPEAGRTPGSAAPPAPAAAADRPLGGRRRCRRAEVRQRQLGLRPPRQMDPGGPDAGVGPPDVALGLAEHLDVTGIQIDRRVAQHQRSAHRCWPHGQPPPVHPAQSGLDPRHPVPGEPPSDRRGGRARRHRRSRQ